MITVLNKETCPSGWHQQIAKTYWLQHGLVLNLHWLNQATISSSFAQDHLAQYKQKSRKRQPQPQGHNKRHHRW